MTTKASRRNRRGQSRSLTDGGKPGGGKSRAGTPPGRRNKRRPPPVKVGTDRNWGAIATFATVGAIAAGLIGYAFWAQRENAGVSWQQQAASIEGVVNYRDTNPDMLTNQHVAGDQQYEVAPPVGGNHNGTWQDCQGTVYAEPIHEEHALHSLEHGAVWVTYNPDQLTPEQVDQLAGLVEGTDKTFLSPYPGLDSPVSLQAWGYQLKLSDPGDGRVSEFVRTMRINASLEGPTASCDGITTTAANPETLTQGG